MRNLLKKHQNKTFVVSCIAILFSLYTNINLAQEKTKEGESVFNKTCASCHTGGFKAWMSGAPEIGDIEDWTPYFTQGVDSMISHVINGTQKHELKGGCESCTDQQIINAVNYIIVKTKISSAEESGK